MDDEDPDALESFLKFLYAVDINHIKYRNVVHNYVPEDWFSHIVKVFVLADKFDKPLLRAAMANLINNEPEGGGWLKCRDRGCRDHFLCLDESPFDVLEAYGATFEDDFPAVDDAPEVKRKLQEGLFNSIHRATLFMDNTPLEQMSDIQRDLYDRAVAVFQTTTPLLSWTMLGARNSTSSATTSRTSSLEPRTSACASRSWLSAASLDLVEDLTRVRFHEHEFDPGFSAFSRRVQVADMTRGRFHEHDLRPRLSPLR